MRYNNILSKLFYSYLKFFEIYFNEFMKITFFDKIKFINKINSI